MLLLQVAVEYAARQDRAQRLFVEFHDHVSGAAPSTTFCCACAIDGSRGNHRAGKYTKCGDECYSPHHRRHKCPNEVACKRGVCVICGLGLVLDQQRTFGERCQFRSAVALACTLFW
jgi:hypothetical protein